MFLHPPADIDAPHLLSVDTRLKIKALLDIRHVMNG